MELTQRDPEVRSAYLSRSANSSTVVFCISTCHAFYGSILAPGGSSAIGVVCVMGVSSAYF
jgi:hypothetical protein